MNLIKDRDARTKKRQKAKRKLDKDITLAMSPIDSDKLCTLALNHSEGTVRLLDEGAIVTAEGDLQLYIKKGVIKKYVSGKNTKLTPRSLYGDLADDYFVSPDMPMNLDEKYEGTINIGHHNFAEFPCGIVGTWTQNDLSVVSNEDGRKGLDVDLKLNEMHPLVQALRVQGIPVGVSVEMYLHFDDKATEEETERRNEYTPVVDEIFIADFAIVGECGNVGSSGSVDLQGVTMDEPVKDIEEELKLSVSPSDEKAGLALTIDPSDEEAELEEVAEENEMPEDVEDTEAEAEETTEEVAKVEEAVEEEHPAEDEGVDEEVIDEVKDEEDEDEEDALKVAEEAIETLKAENEALKEQVEALKKSNKKKDNKIKEYAEKNEEAVKKFKSLSVSLGLTKEVKKEATHKLYATGDGIGE